MAEGDGCALAWPCGDTCQRAGLADVIAEVDRAGRVDHSRGRIAAGIDGAVKRNAVAGADQHCVQLQYAWAVEDLFPRGLEAGRGSRAIGDIEDDHAVDRHHARRDAGRAPPPAVMFSSVEPPGCVASIVRPASGEAPPSAP